MSSLRKFGSFLAGALLCTPTQAHAEEPAVTTAPHPFAYGVMVGANVGGAGQQPLRYAEDDARRMADVLKQLGRYGNADLRVLVKPDTASVLSAVDDVATKMRAHQAKGEQAILVFYYSGHARANAFSLGAEELPIATLREKLRQIPSTLTLVVLDACQSGTFARVKGVEPAADFTYNSVSRLTTKGIAVMTSSSAQELSQESDELKSSYFTHHLVVALRGAADADGDGRVSLDEAYRYAYRRTLASTSQTQVGGQHVTLDTDLAGQGDVPVTYPADVRSQLELPGALEGRVLVQHKPSGSVVAEVQKAQGPPLRLAFAAGAYEATIREAASLSRGTVLKCKLSLSDDRVTPLVPSACEQLRAVSAVKGEEPDVVEGIPTERRSIEPWAIEGGLGFMSRVEDSFTRSLNQFGYERARGLIEFPRGRATLAVSRGLFPHLALGVQLGTLGGDRYQRNIGDSSDEFTWSAYGASTFVRASTALVGTAAPRSMHLDLYGQVGVGVTLGYATLKTGSTRTDASETSSETHWGYVVGGALGLLLATRSPLAFFVQGSYDHAPTVANQLDERHDAGGPAGQLGLRFRLGE